MNIYIYAKSGHNIGLESVRRCAVLYKQLEQCDPILCTSDYRAATFARDLGVYKGLGIDIIGNLPNIMERSDMLIFDSDEPSEEMRKFMAEYCTHLYEVGVDIPKTLVDDKFFEKGDQSIKKAFFFGDDDYGDILLKELCKDCGKLEIPLLMGHYFFFGNEEKLAPSFSNIIEEEEYFDTILNTKYLLTSSINSVFESLASGNCPVFYKRSDKSNEDLQFLKEYSIPVVDGKNMNDIVSNFEDVISNYPKVKTLEKTDIENIKNTICQTIEKFKAIMPSLESSY
ncbi:MAG: hypothetical protein KAQ94_04315 [Arcobacteraceae bacterium]|nr:hypothetical protein [Arcobacteraceae bacterium]